MTLGSSTGSSTEVGRLDRSDTGNAHGTDGPCCVQLDRLDNAYAHAREAAPLEHSAKLSVWCCKVGQRWGKSWVKGRRELAGSRSPLPLIFVFFRHSSARIVQKLTASARGPQNAAMAKRGAPSKLTPEVTKKVCQAARLGLKWASCARYAGVSPQVLVLWRKQGREQQRGKYRDFLVAVEQARAEGERRHAQVIMDAATQGDWRASETALRLMYGYETPSKLSLNGELRHQHQSGVLIAPAEMTAEDWIALQERLQLPGGSDARQEGEKREPA